MAGTVPLLCAAITASALGAMAKHQFEILDFFETFLIQMNLTVEALNGEGPN